MMSEEMKVLISTAEMMRAGMEALGVEFQNINGEWTAKKVRKSRTTKSTEYSPTFKEMMAIYPKRKDSIAWSEAWPKWELRVREGDSEETLLRGAEAYLKCMKAEGKVGTNYVMMPSRFFGVHKHYLREWVEGSGEPMSKKEKEAKRAKLKKEPWAIVPPVTQWEEVKAFVKQYGYRKPEFKIQTPEDASRYMHQLVAEVNHTIEKML